MLNLMPYLVVWSLVAAIVIVLAVYRQIIAHREDLELQRHAISGGASVTARQADMERRLESIDRWGKILTVIAFLYGLALGGVHLYRVWVAGSTPI